MVNYVSSTNLRCITILFIYFHLQSMGDPLGISPRKLRLDDPLDFSEGDHGVSGGIQAGLDVWKCPGTAGWLADV